MALKIVEALFDFFLVRIVAIFLLGLISTITDLKSGLIYDKITYPAIALGILINLIELNVVGLLVGVVIFIASYVFYYLGGIGGGDVKLFTATAFLVPFYNGLPFILSVLFFASIASIIVFSLYYIVQTYKNNSEIVKKKLPKIGFYVTVFFLLFLFFYQIRVLSFLSFAFLSSAFILAAPYIALKKEIQGVNFLRNIQTSDLEEDEIIAKEFLDEKIKNELSLGKKGILTKKEQEKLISLGIKTVPVYRGLPPFAPFFLLGIIITIIFPDLFFLAFAPAFI